MDVITKRELKKYKWYSREIAWAIFEKGVELEAVHRKAPHDPGGEIKDVLLRSGVPFEMRLFREVVCQKQGWSIKQSQR